MAIKIAMSNKLLEYNFTGTSKQKFKATILLRTVIENSEPNVTVFLKRRSMPPITSARPVNILYAVEYPINLHNNPMGEDSAYVSVE